MSTAPGRPKHARTAVRSTKVFMMSTATGRHKHARTAVSSREEA